MKVAASFSGLTMRQLRNWYKLAKIEIGERRKIEEFAFRLMEE
jgi:hypothetical protein